MEEKTIQQELSYPIVLTERIRKAVEEADSFKQECSELGRLVDQLAQMFRSTARLAASKTSNLYEKPIRRIVTEVIKNLEKTLALVRKCKHSGILKMVVTFSTSAADFRKLFNLLDNSSGDMKWLLSICNGGGGIVLSLPPIASIDPILSWVWSYIAVIQTGTNLEDKVEAANSLASLALDNDRNKKIIIEEGGIGPLLKLLKDGGGSEIQIAAATVLVNLASDQDKVKQITEEKAIPLIFHMLCESPMRVQIRVAKLVSRMAAHDPFAQEEFARESVTTPLVSHLSFEVLEDWIAPVSKATTLHSVVLSTIEVNKGTGGSVSGSVSVPTNSNTKLSQPSGSSSSRGLSSREINRKEREKENPEVKLELKNNCAEALYNLARNCVVTSRRITETKGLLCLAKIIETKQGELQFNCLMVVMEIAVAAEMNPDFRKAAFRTNSPAAKAVVAQLLRLIQEENPTLQIPAIRSIGSLARTFPARETRVIAPLVNQLGNRNNDVAAEAAIALGKFASPDNFLCVEHSRTIVEFDGLSSLLRLVRASERGRLDGLVLLCYLALVPGNAEALERARALAALELVGRSSMAQHPLLRELLPKAIYHLELCQAVIQHHREAHIP